MSEHRTPLPAWLPLPKWLAGLPFSKGDKLNLVLLLAIFVVGVADLNFWMACAAFMGVSTEIQSAIAADALGMVMDLLDRGAAK